MMNKNIFTRGHIGVAIELVVGYILSPLSWWNDLLVNVPLAYLFSYPFSLFNEEWFLPAFVVGYWLTNLAGLLLMHSGAVGLVSWKKKSSGWKGDLLISLLYTLIIVVLVQFDFIPPPAELLEAFTNE